MQKFGRNQQFIEMSKMKSKEAELLLAMEIQAARNTLKQALETIESKLDKYLNMSIPENQGFEESDEFEEENDSMERIPETQPVHKAPSKKRKLYNFGTAQDQDMDQLYQVIEDVDSGSDSDTQAPSQRFTRTSVPANPSRLKILPIPDSPPFRSWDKNWKTNKKKKNKEKCDPIFFSSSLWNRFKI